MKINMNLFKLTVLITFYFITRAALASSCEELKSLTKTYNVCWSDTYKGWISDSCEKNKSCGALKFFESPAAVTKMIPQGGQNPNALVCHALKLPVIILRDKRNNEQSFCEFPDKTVADANSIAKSVK